MLKGVFPRLFGNFREGALVHAKFVVTAGPVYTLKSAVPGSNYNGLSLVKDTSTGFLALTLAGGARQIAVLSAMHLNIADPADVTDYLNIFATPAFVEGTGVLKFRCITSDGTEAFADPQATDELHFSLYVAK
jgi:hypothetical protein